jgi:bifunctional non-homologous end joining protein LigD
MTTAAANTGKTQTLRIGRRVLSLSNLDKVLYPAADFTKGDVIHYYLRIARAVLPHLKGRPLTLKRYPNGVDAPYFYEKRCPSHKPEWVTTSKVSSNKSGGVINYCVVDDVTTLVWIANLASLELHPLLSKAPNYDRPTMMVFDFDPGEPANVLDAAQIAMRVRDMLAHLGLKSFPKTSGGKGIHMAVPLNTPVTFDQTKTFSKAVAETLERDDPSHVVSRMSKSLRAGKVFVDWSQNDEHKTTASVYSLRAKQRPTVSTPITWDELESAVKDRDPDALTFETDAVLQRVTKRGDLFESVLKLKQRLPKSFG